VEPDPTTKLIVHKGCGLSDRVTNYADRATPGRRPANGRNGSKTDISGWSANGHKWTWGRGGPLSAHSSQAHTS
jgi:hypothetical protein